MDIVSFYFFSFAYPYFGLCRVEAAGAGCGAGGGCTTGPGWTFGGIIMGGAIICGCCFSSGMNLAVTEWNLQMFWLTFGFVFQLFSKNFQNKLPPQMLSYLN